MTTYYTQRPWHRSYTHAIEKRNLDQVHKLARNYIASLDLGGSNMNLVRYVDDDVDTIHMTSKEKYLQWVKNWKAFYKALSELIRIYKKDDRAELFRLKETAQVMLNARHIGKLASWAVVQRNKRLNVT